MNLDKNLRYYREQAYIMFKRPPTEYEIIKQNNEKRNRKIFGTTIILFIIIVVSLILAR